MQAMVFHKAHCELVMESRPDPSPADQEVLVKVEACAVCRTDLHVQDNELAEQSYPIIPGHQVVGRVVKAGEQSPLSEDSRVGITWLGWTCGDCEYCRTERENLCGQARFHGYQIDGGFADYMLVDSRYCIELNRSQPAAEIAPLLCAGLIGFRSLNMAGEAPECRDLRVRVSGSHRYPGRSPTESQDLRVYASWRYRDSKFCKRTGCRVGRWVR